MRIHNETLPKFRMDGEHLRRPFNRLHFRGTYTDNEQLKIPNFIKDNIKGNQTSLLLCSAISQCEPKL